MQLSSAENIYEAYQYISRRQKNLTKCPNIAYTVAIKWPLIMTAHPFFLCG